MGSSAFSQHHSEICISALADELAQSSFQGYLQSKKCDNNCFS